MKRTIITFVVACSVYLASAQTAIIKIEIDGPRYLLRVYESKKEVVEVGSYSIKDFSDMMKRILENIDVYKLNGYRLTAVSDGQYVLEK